MTIDKGVSNVSNLSLHFLSWDCRGLGRLRAIPILCGRVKSHKADVVFLSETLVHAVWIEEVRIKLGFAGAFSIDVFGRSKGLAVLWR